MVCMPLLEKMVSYASSMCLFFLAVAMLTVNLGTRTAVADFYFPSENNIFSRDNTEEPPPPTSCMDARLARTLHVGMKLLKTLRTINKTGSRSVQRLAVNMRLVS